MLSEHIVLFLLLNKLIYHKGVHYYKKHREQIPFVRGRNFIR